MKVSRLKIKNIGKIVDETIELDKPLILFYGEIRQGKTTILNAVRWVCGGAFPSDIIRHGEKDASVSLEFDGGVISRSWYVSKEGATKAREVVFVRNGKPVPSPVSEIKRFLNPFLIDQDYLRNMSELDRKKYFSELFAVDTTALDTEAVNSEREARDLRAKIRGYGEIDLTPVEPVDISDLKAQLQEMRTAHAAEVQRIATNNTAIRELNKRIDLSESHTQTLRSSIKSLEQQLEAAKRALTDHLSKLESCERKEELPAPVAPDTAKLEAAIENASAQNVRAEQYGKNLKRDEERKRDEAELTKLEKRQREIKAEKIAKLKGISDSCQIKDLAFDASGNFTYQGTEAGMLSTSQIMQLSSELSALYPEGFGLDLIDRAESLGKSIFAFVDRAKSEKKTILATIVGERPASVPANIGVFVVDDGKVSPC